MSKKQTSLLKFFGTPSPKTLNRGASKINQNQDIESKENAKSDNNADGGKKRVLEDSDENEQPLIPTARKRIKMVIDSDESDNESEVNTPKKAKLGPSKASKLNNESEVNTPKNSKAEPSKASKIDFNNKKPTSIKKDTKETEVLPHQAANLLKAKELRESFLHTTLPFLQPDKIKDANGVRPTHPNYDPTTCYIPRDFIEKQTPGMQQWWELKSQYFDAILFFKVGKFYELYHMDAVVGVEQLGFSYMKSNQWAHSGFPETAYGRMAASLVEKGYKVARIEQTETPDQMQERSKTTPGKKLKVVRREICQITTKATQVYNVQDAAPSRPTSTYLLAICEKGGSYGVCFVETSLGKFYVGQFDDDIHRSGLFLMVAHYPPAMILYPKSGLSETTITILKSSFLSSVKKQSLIPSKQFLTAEETIKFINKKGYFEPEGWPKNLDQSGKNLALSALGGVSWFLNYSKIDDQLFGMKNFELYAPPPPAQAGDFSFGSHMVLDAITMHHLRIVDAEVSLYDKINYCKTPFGKRLLRQWICSPLCDPDLIKERQLAIEELLESGGTLHSAGGLQSAGDILSKLPDLERLVAIIHSMGNKVRSTTHPDSRAIMFEEKSYTKKKIGDFCATLEAFENLQEMKDIFSDFKSKLIRRVTQNNSEGGEFPDMSRELIFFKKAFDRENAKKNGTILPSRSANEAYDRVLTEIEDLEQELEVYRKMQETQFKCKVVYFGTDRKRFQLEIPVDRANKVTSEYHLEGTKKGFKRYSTPETKEFLAQMQQLEERKRLVLLDLARSLFEKFGQSFELWSKAAYCIAVLDVLMSLAQYSLTSSGDMCTPKVVIPEGEPFIEIYDGRHPSIATTDFIPNDTSLGTNGIRQMLVLTGPNMGGKSTLMRQVALITVLAQIGSQVPARECSLSIVDRIFTRIGARDDIMGGSSTFLVELKETNSILKYASRHSLALLDELGRGTSTHDGSSIAGGVVHFLANRKIRTVFSTHYHQLIDAYKSNESITLGHMSCIVEDEKGDEDVTFLYKFALGACPKSYGFNAARLAGLPQKILQKGSIVSKNIEVEIKNIRSYLQIMQLDPNKDLANFLSSLLIN